MRLNRNDRNSNSRSTSDNSSSNVLYRALTERLRQLSFAAFETGVLLWLGAKGYRDICVLKRSAARGRRPIGGADFIARPPYDPNVKVAIQVCHWQTPIQRRAVDELWGFLLRQGIPQGLIVTNSVFSPRAMTAAQEFPGRPIKLVSVAQLAGSMTALGLGVDSDGKQWTVSEAFFRTLYQLRPASRLIDGPAPAPRRFNPANRLPATLDDVSTNPPPPQQPRYLWLGLLFGALLVILVWWLAGGGWR